MIEKCFFMARGDIKKLAMPVAVMTTFHGAINISNSNQEPEEYPKWVHPVLKLSFDDIYISERMSERDKKFHIKNKEKQGLIFFTDKMAQRAIFFMNELHKSERNWILFVNCEGGISRSATFARWLSAIIGCQIQGVSYPNTDHFNPLVMQLLNTNYGKLFQSELNKEITSNESSTKSNSINDPKTSLRREEDNSRV